LRIASIVVSEKDNDTVPLEETVADIARFAGGAEVIGLPRLPGGLTQHPAFGRIAARL
jgi:hypothetical protein